MFLCTIDKFILSFAVPIQKMMRNSVPWSDENQQTCVAPCRVATGNSRKARRSEGAGGDGAPATQQLDKGVFINGQR